MEMNNDYYQQKMGNEKSMDELTIPTGCKLYSKMTLTSPQQQQYIKHILSKRGNFFMNQHICTVSGYQFLEVEPNKISCEQSKELIVFYDSFDYVLSDIPVSKYAFTQNDICTFLSCIIDALKFLRNHNHRHGDISLKNICRKGNLWKLIDKTFIKNGVTAYERVLEGQQGFISPEQMQRIRFGFVRESPPITESDDIFALGMVILQLSSKISSFACYKESFIRFNEENIEKHLDIVCKKFSREFFEVLKSMIHPEEEKRINLDQLSNHPMIRSNNKYSLKNLTSVTSSRGNNPRQSLKQSYISNMISTKQHSPIPPTKNHSVQKPPPNPLMQSTLPLRSPYNQ